MLSRRPYHLYLLVIAHPIDDETTMMKRIRRATHDAVSIVTLWVVLLAVALAIAVATAYLPPQNPPWPPTYNVTESLITMQCNSSGFSNISRALEFGIVSYDWSNA